MPLPALTIPPWLPGWLSYTVVTVDGGVTGLDALLVSSNALAGITLIAMMIYKMLMRKWDCNDAKRDRPVLFCVALLDVCAAVAWSVRLDRSGFCAKQQARGNKACHTALIGVALTFSWIAVAIAYCSAVWADHGAKKQKRRPSPLPLHVPNPSTRLVISAPKLIDAGQFNECVRDDDIKFGGFTPIPI